MTSHNNNNAKTNDDASFQQRLQEKQQSYETSKNETLKNDEFDAIFSDNPNIVYFRQMMEMQSRNRLAMGKSMDDSIIGTETLADFMGGGTDVDDDDDQSKDDSFMDYQYYKSADTKKKSSSPSRRQPPQNLAIVGLETDDLSTIANDTINGSVIDPPHKHSSSSSPRKRNFQEYGDDADRKNNGQRSKSTTQRSPSSPSDDSTFPETPPGFIRVPGGSNQDKDGDVDGDDDDDDNSYLEKSFEKMQQRSRRIYLIALCLGVILLAAIAALSITLLRLRSDSTATAAANDASSPTSDNRDVTLFTRTPTGAPQQGGTTATNIPTTAPVAMTTLTPTTMAPTANPTRAPQTELPTTTSFTENAINFQQILGTAEPEYLSSLQQQQDESSPQFQAYAWIASDPNYSSYTDRRILQRYALACVAYSIPQELNLDRFTTRRRNLQMTTTNTETWLSYNTNECDWVSTHPNGLCNEFGGVNQIHFENMNLQGRLVSELSLLAETLEILSLPNNRFRGEIPTSYGKLDKLEILDLSGNRLSEAIPSELGQLPNLGYLSLTNNNLSDAIPTEFGNLFSLETLDLSENELTGILPSQFGGLALLEIFDVQQNQLIGNVPIQYGNLRNLASFELDGNGIGGTMPEGVCTLTRTRALDVLVADCHKIDCECCTDCSPAPPTDLPSMAPTSSPSSGPTRLPTVQTQRPTVLPSSPPTTAPPSDAPTVVTSSPTSAPTGCRDVLVTDKACYRPGETITISFFTCDSEQFDWIGIYDAAQTNFLEQWLYWVWTCGTQSCRSEVANGVLEWNENFPVNRDFKLHLFRNSNRPYVKFASSETIQIRNSCPLQ
mmetsp:Transcript_17532/g.49524  ORF Transcript_17532/g.49524 Transcript_17532/m.49524 type:complete len:837 (-) Transcript_17532:127-2637(-)